MSFQLSGLSKNIVSDLTYGAAGIVAAIIVASLLRRGPNLDHIPTVGCSGWLDSLWAGFKWRTNADEVVRGGYEKYKSAPFKVAEQYHWLVVVNSREHIDELRRAPDDVLSFDHAVNERFSTSYMLGGSIADSPYHAGVVRTHLTRNMAVLYPEMRDEIVKSFDEVLNLEGNEWKSIPALNTIRQIISRTNSRVFVGLPLCRNEDWINLNIQYAIDVFKASVIVRLFPKFIRSLAAYFLVGGARRSRILGLKYLGPIIEERLKDLNEYGAERNEKPNDLISWLIEEGKGPQLTVASLVCGVMSVNFASIHTSSNSFTSALLHLAENPRYAQLLREEVEAIVENEGWSKDSLSKMHKVDSFLRESQRLEGSGSVSLVHMALKNFIFADGTFIPKGTLIGIAARCLHHDDRLYENANVFKPFRFADMREGDEDGEGMKFQFVSATHEYLPFGYGRHACPGRFFAAIELKSILAHIVVTYDIKLDNNATYPNVLRFGAASVLNPRVRLLFKKRAD